MKYILLIIGLLQVIGLVPGLELVKKIGVLTVASPLPLVFSHFRGYETFSGDFYMRLYQNNEIQNEINIDSKLYSQLKGPYNRRNVFGAIFSYGPLLDKDNERILVSEMIKNIFCNGIVLREEMGYDEVFDEIEIGYLPKGFNSDGGLSVKEKCP